MDYFQLKLDNGQTRNHDNQLHNTQNTGIYDELAGINADIELLAEQHQAETTPKFNLDTIVAEPTSTTYFKPIKQHKAPQENFFDDATGAHFKPQVLS